MLRSFFLCYSSHITHDITTKTPNLVVAYLQFKVETNQIMAHLITPAPTTATTVLYSRAQKSSLYSWKNVYFPTPRVCCVGYKYQHQISAISNQDRKYQQPLRRRALMGLSGALLLGLSLSNEQNASAGGRPPPPPPREKKDPNVSGVQAKVMASKRRKEAMKETVAKLRDKGKTINEESLPTASQ
ncbi:putative CRIB domain-containing protein [Lupinus albus]|uniref:Putative CRIB domain-containing protein n=1 Tax=Lupinus albus TaxID=3870 RepID=A0A6A4P683_LUPAL|nr:putative CRIB domain-containing protein [Lupinus albus]